MPVTDDFFVSFVCLGRQQDRKTGIDLGESPLSAPKNLGLSLSNSIVQSIGLKIPSEKCGQLQLKVSQVFFFALRSIFDPSGFELVTVSRDFIRELVTLLRVQFSCFDILEGCKKRIFKAFVIEKLL